MSNVNTRAQLIAKRAGLRRENNAKTRNGYWVYYRKGLFGGKIYYRIGKNTQIRISPMNIIRTYKKPNNRKKSNNNNNRNILHHIA
jgi:hypothetical protein